MIVMLGLSVALLWGSADTLAMFATRKIGSNVTTFMAQLSGLFLVAIVGLAFARPLGLLAISASSLVLSVLLGIVLGGVSAGAFLSLYKSLNHGPLAVVSPVVSAQGGVTLVMAVILLQERLAGFQMLFLLLTFVGVLLASINVKELVSMRPKSLLSPGVLYGLVAMLCFGVLAFGLGLASRSTNWLVSVFFIRCFSFLLIAVIQRKDSPQTGKTGWMWGYLLAIVVGCADIGGQGLLSLATASGSIGVAGMIASAYAVLPLAVGVFFLKERLSLSQLLGCVLLGAGLAGEAAPGPGLALPLAGLAVALVVGSGLAVFRDVVKVKPVRAWSISWPFRLAFVTKRVSTSPLNLAEPV
jgi:drug/metabolite transporter (DMT)-like permease